MHRTYWFNAHLDEKYGGADERIPCAKADANLVSSFCAGQTHMPVLDIDYEATLIPSSTPGHSHLYLNQLVTWRQYKRVLRALAAAGLIEQGFYKHSVRRKATFVRPPGVKKTSATIASS